MDHNQVTLKEAIGKLLQEFHLSEGYAKQEALSEWNRTMPESIRRRITALCIQRGTLLIRTDSAALRNELSMQKTKIKDDFNRAAGRALIQDVKLG